MRSKYILYLLLPVALAILPLACGNGLDITPGEYDLAVLNGPWFLDKSAGGAADGYFVADGLGNIVDHSFFDSAPAGSYTMTNGGTFTVDLKDGTVSQTTFEGRMRDYAEGRVDKLDGSPVTGAEILKVTDVSTLSGTFSGSLTQTCLQSGTTDKNICDDATYIVNGLSVDSTGAVTGGSISNTTDTFTVSSSADSGAYAVGSSVIIYFHTSGSDTEHRPYDIIKITGTLSGSTISGTYELYSSLLGHVGNVSLNIP